MFYYELHAHTSAASLCSHVRAEDYVKFYMDRGYSGMVVTDHFYYGNTCIDRDLPWDEFVDRFCDGYRRVYAEGQKHGFDVFFGFEQKFLDGTDEYLVLGITPEWLTSHPEIKDMSRREFFDTVHKANGFIIQAHPFRVRFYIPDVRLAGNAVDAVEVLNMGHEDIYSRQAYEYARNIGAVMVGGSDIHSIEGEPDISGVTLDKRVHDISELIDEIRLGRAQIAPSERFLKVSELPLCESVDRDVYVLSGDELVKTDDYFMKNR